MDCAWSAAGALAAMAAATVARRMVMRGERRAGAGMAGNLECGARPSWQKAGRRRTLAVVAASVYCPKGQFKHAGAQPILRAPMTAGAEPTRLLQEVPRISRNRSRGAALCLAGGVVLATEACAQDL